MTKNPSIGSNLDDFLKDEGIQEEATLNAIKKVVALQLLQAMEEKKLTKSAMAERMQTTRGQLDRVLNPQDGNVTLETLQRAARAVGRTIRLELV